MFHTPVEGATRASTFTKSDASGKKAATRLLELQKQIRAKLTDGSGKTAEEVARSIDADPEDVFHVLPHLASNDPHIRVSQGAEPADDQFSYADYNAAD
jgi:hypothetical protein